jgi:hypothetical protein
MRSIILEGIKNNTFMPFPDGSFAQGTDGTNNFNNIDHLIREKYESIETLKEDNSYTTWNYCGQDDEKTFRFNSKLSKDDWYYKNNTVNYTLNSFGYRTKNFNEIDWANSIVIFGCSYVQGVGVDDFHTLSYFLEKEMNLPVINMGVGGSSNEFHTYNSNILLTQYPKPKAVIFALTAMQRYPIYHWDYIHHRGSWTDNKSQMKANRSNSIIRSITTSNTMNNIWKMFRSKTAYIEYSVDYFSYKFIEEMNPNKNRFYFNPISWPPSVEYNHRGTSQSEFARDFSHPSRHFHSSLSKSLSEVLKSRIN